MQKIGLDKDIGTKQLVVVTTNNWTNVQGKMNVFEFIDNSWEPVMENISVTVGRNGLAWGKGLHSDRWNIGEMKREGDGKSPAGIFKLGDLFGYEDLTFTQMNYVKVIKSILCIDDKNSPHYNQIVDMTKIAKDWNSAEEMCRGDELYKYGIFVDYNTDPIVPGAGSCIFMHIRAANNEPTDGCTAMDKENILQLIHFLNKSMHPVLVQMPENEYHQFKNAYNLPSI
ncbi:unnamed protein product [Didymodactylos carnosus]|uniref:L,D-TPase catalytic domain-containing protein n=1 Tax=Didymodactylos carnosus TaxID=1234261 RepID=A0A815T050_9BILA|nr:unnamed protein product [Didymodactylos carnosus]CAF4358023.1 unnamed protein product [Didymodactylos carnosus]